MINSAKKFNIKTRYSSMILEENSEFYTLRAEGNAIHSSISKTAPHKLQLKNLEYLMGILMFIPPPEKILLLGTGGGSVIHFFHHYYPTSLMTCVDIDEELVQISQDKMELPKESSRIRYHFADAKEFIASSNDSYDLILVDIFTGSSSPDWLVKPLFLNQLQSSLNSQHGALAMNLLINSPSDFKVFYKNLRQIFNQKTLCLEVAGFENILAFAIKNQKSSFEINEIRMISMDQGKKLNLDFGEILAQIAITNPIGAGII